MSPERRAQMHRFMATQYRIAAAKEDLCAALATTSATLMELGRAMAEAEAYEVAHHPDLAELNVQLDGFYGEVL
ncbi:hypothetical protein [Streptomyces rubiginosohelvolus]|uniref:hypothetical protein n=1 Tax=Streptomyces rubiginosohelvolus TaxID=67362 RepID=UPI00378F9A82